MNTSIYLASEALFDPTASVLYSQLQNYLFPWEILRDLSELILQLGEKLEQNGYRQVTHQIWMGNNVNVAPTAVVTAPCIIGHNTEIRHCAYIRGHAVIGNHCVIGNSTEVKNAVLFDRVHIPHFNYVGDSILGKGVHLGAGTILSNLKSDGTNVKVRTPDGTWETNMRKFGALIGNNAEVGCNCVINPGTVIGKDSRIYPLNSLRGFIPEGHIYKNSKEIVPIQ